LGRLRESFAPLAAERTVVRPAVRRLRVISHERFGELRLAQFLPHAELAELANWEFMDHTWVGEALGFSEWLRLASDPVVLRSLALDFSEFPEVAATAVLNAIELPVRPGMQAADLRSVLGEPVEEQNFVAGRVTYDFAIVGPPRYSVSCTVAERRGLTYLVVMVPLRGLGA
jgi:hypothetical protein